jgi:hypothetical protein
MSDAKGSSTERTMWRSIYDEFIMLTELGGDPYHISREADAHVLSMFEGPRFLKPWRPHRSNTELIFYAAIYICNRLLPRQTDMGRMRVMVIAYIERGFKK